MCVCVCVCVCGCVCKYVCMYVFYVTFYSKEMIDSSSVLLLLEIVQVKRMVGVI